MEGYVDRRVDRQFVGIDLHRRRSVIVRMDAVGQVLQTEQILNDAQRLVEVVAAAGEAPEVVLEATYGWYWGGGRLAGQRRERASGASAGVKAFEYRRVKNDVRDASDLADLLRMGRLPEAWIAPPATRELRELVRHRAKLVALRSHCKAQVHALLAKCGIQVPMSDLFGVGGTALLDQVAAQRRLPPVYLARIASLRRVIDEVDFEIDVFARMARGRLAGPDYAGAYAAVQAIPGIGPILAAVFLAEIGDVHRFARAEQLTCWAGLTPKHHESDTHVHRGKITKQGSRLIRWAAVESVKKAPKHSPIGQLRERVAPRRGANVATVAAARQQLEYVYYALRDGHVRALQNPKAANIAERAA